MSCREPAGTAESYTSHSNQIDSHQRYANEIKRTEETNGENQFVRRVVEENSLRPGVPKSECAQMKEYGPSVIALQ
jgi:hypothetical protein